MLISFERLLSVSVLYGIMVFLILFNPYSVYVIYIYLGSDTYTNSGQIQ